MNVFDLRFQAWLARETGIDPASLGDDFVARALLERIAATQAGDDARRAPAVRRGQPVSDQEVDAYWQLLNTSADERRALIELFVVPETWFFREREAFAALARLALIRLHADPARVLRLLSAPCSTGEEPYSAAMALLDAGLDPVRFTIDAIDISGRAIAQAERACYGRNSFRGHALEFRARHFQRTDAGWALDERVRQCVRFARTNLLELSGDADARYDFIFCRNVLIYFEPGAQDQVMRTVDERLAADGVVFVGPAETGVAMRHGMMSTKIPLAFGFRRPTAADGPPPPVPLTYRPAAPVTRGVAARAGGESAWQAGMPPFAVAPTLAVPPRSLAHEWFADAAWPLLDAERGRAGKPRAHAAAGPQTGVSHGTGTSLVAPSDRSAETALDTLPDPSLDAARALADAGAFDAAAQAVAAFVDAAGPHADAFYLLGLIADAQGRRADAADFYRKALYLEPAHHEALTHLATSLDVSGDRTGAQSLMQRAQRAVRRAAGASLTETGNPRGAHGPRRR